MWVICRGNVSKFEINVDFDGVTNVCLQKIKKNFLKLFVALHCPITVSILVV